ncbi:RpiR family transcriptional regulator [Enterococcus florum]|uniref:RpiR family transcriptional regulator n=1 Tax=Enterococcus florum TaxID=2480627 RepID=A0A4P5PFB2_9ENTE|nr:MurR/RpiR family transcriptional regulator [Enterococcus florum]GCF94928.1 RpiR family transcriptional regulator [Enterococcus florum]
MHFADIVNQNYSELNETDLSMSSYIIDHTKELVSMSTQDFAKECLSSKSSVIRFAQKLGFTGFGELRNFIKWQDDEETLDQNMDFQRQIYLDVQKTLSYMEEANWQDIYQKIETCNNIYVLSTGVTQQSQAAEFQRLFLLIGKQAQMIPASAQSNEFRRIVERLSDKDIIFVLSLSGENTHLENVLNVLSVRRSVIVSVTSLQNNWLSGRADYNLYASSSRSPLPKDWWLQTASSFFILIETFAFGYVDYLRKK